MNARKIIDFRLTETTTAEPVSLQDVKDAIRVTFSEDDTFLTKCITGSRKMIENFCNISIITKTVDVIVDVCYLNKREKFISFELPFCPYAITDNNLVVEYKNGFKSTDYQEQTFDQDYFLSGLDYPVLSLIVPGEYKLSYSVGFTTVPEDLLRAIKEEVAFRYENRGDERLPEDLCEMALESCFSYKRMSWL